MPEMIKILIVDDHAVVRKGLAALLDIKPDMIVIGEAANGTEAFHLAYTQKPDVILMDLEMPIKDGVTAIREIKSSGCKSKILVLTNYTDDERVIAAISAGADGYLVKTATPDDVIKAIRVILTGQTPLDPAITGFVLRQLNQSDSKLSDGEDPLSDREITVLKLISQGYTNRQIANELTISERTVSTHITHIFKKLHVENRTEAAIIALKSGLV